jgi:hypothetical protein
VTKSLPISPVFLLYSSVTDRTFSDSRTLKNDANVPVFRIRLFLALPDPYLDSLFLEVRNFLLILWTSEVRIRIRILHFSHNYVERIETKRCLQNRITQNFSASLKSMKKGVGSVSISQRYGSGDPDPHENVTDPQHCLKLV